jgi:hypothetical protein
VYAATRNGAFGVRYLGALTGMASETPEVSAPSCCRGRDRTPGPMRPFVVKLNIALRPASVGATVLGLTALSEAEQRAGYGAVGPGRATWIIAAVEPRLITSADVTR